MDTLLRLLIASLLLIATLFYVRGWKRLHVSLPHLATNIRMVAFAFAMLFIGLALIWPLPGLSLNFLLGRTLQMIALVMLASPFFWLACGFHVIVWGLPSRVRKLTARFWFRNGQRSDLLRSIFTLVVAWFLFLSAVLCWHDSTIADRIMPNPWLRNFAPLWLLVVGLLFWWQIVGTGPRRFTTRSSIARIGALLGVEVLNVAMGMYIAFHEAPIYRYYSDLRSANPTYYMNTIASGIDQSTSGGINWVFGSAVFFGSVILVVNAMWQRVANSEQPQPPVNWDSDEKFIMPGLENRLNSNPRRIK